MPNKRFQFSLKTFLVGGLAIGYLAGLAGIAVKKQVDGDVPYRQYAPVSYSSSSQRILELHDLDKIFSLGNFEREPAIQWLYWDYSGEVYGKRKR